MGCDTLKPPTMFRPVSTAEAGGVVPSPAVALTDKPHRRIDIDLSVAPPSPGYKEYNLAGSVVWVNRALGAAPEIQIAFDEDGLDQAIWFQSNYFLRGKPYRRIRVYWSVQAASSMTLILFNDKPNDTVGIL